MYIVKYLRTKMSWFYLVLSMKRNHDKVTDVFWSTYIFKVAICCTFLLGYHTTTGFLEPSTFSPASVKVEHDIQWNNKIIHNRQFYVPGIIFKCKFDKATGNLFYTITWHINDNTSIRKAITQTPDDGKSDLRESDLGDRKYGFDITCRVTAYNSAIGSPINSVESSPFFAGIRAKTSKVTVERGGHTLFEVEFTVPFGCMADELSATCSIDVEMDYNRFMSKCGELVGVIGHPYACMKSVPGYSKMSYQKGVKWLSTFYWNISNTDDGIYPYHNFYSNKYKLSLKATTSSSINKLWNDYHIADIDVDVIDRVSSLNKARCYIHANDKHMGTFDDSINVIETTGVFTMYRNKIIPVEVQIQVKPCANVIHNGHCVCGVYIRAGHDMFVISTCSHNYFHDFVSCNDGSITVDYKGTDLYEINLPTRAKVTVHKTNKWLNVDILTASFDKGNVEGLCKNLDWNSIGNSGNVTQTTQCRNGDQSSQCRDKFISHYRVPESQILFPITDTNRNYIFSLPVLYKSTSYCVCPYDDGGLHSFYAASRCSYKRHLRCNYHANSLPCDRFMKPSVIQRMVRDRNDRMYNQQILDIGLHKSLGDEQNANQTEINGTVGTEDKRKTN